MLSAEEQNTVNTYNAIAPQWVKTHALAFWNKEYRIFQNYLPAGKIIDLGCGGGADSAWFVKNNYEYIGIDASQGMLAEASKSYPNTKFLLKDFYNLDFPKNSFDGFWSACSLLHIPKNRINTALNNIRKILKPRAVGFISIKKGTNFSKKAWHESGRERFFAYYQQDEFAKILKNQGFYILQTGVRPQKNADQDGTFLIFYIQLCGKN
jgi:ubiquinone/menaquinone biosynthesis C-methylase UbiE